MEGGGYRESASELARWAETRLENNMAADPHFSSEERKRLSAWVHVHLGVETVEIAFDYLGTTGTHEWDGTREELGRIIDHAAEMFRTTLQTEREEFKTSTDRTDMNSRGIPLAIKGLLVGGTAIALISVGGLGVYLGPVLIVGHWLVARSTLGPWRYPWFALAALCAAETAWGIAYVIEGEDGILILVLPLIAVLLVLAIFAKTLPRTPESA
jgi:hypothetical protein